MKKLIVFTAVVLSVQLAQAQTFTPPTASVDVVKNIDFKGQAVGQTFMARFAGCDNQKTYTVMQSGKLVTHYGCIGDKNHNSVLLKLKGGVIFFNAKMGLDADGSPLSKKREGTNQPETSLRYPLPKSPSVNADSVPYIVIPQGGFSEELGVRIGDVAAVVYGTKRVFAVVADAGPKNKIGEGSIQIHELLGHAVCRERAQNGDCVKLLNAGIGQNVLYFIFPNTYKEFLPNLTPDNIGERIEKIGAQEWQKLMSP